jgi:hypothetical protein
LSCSGILFLAGKTCVHIHWSVRDPHPLALAIRGHQLEAKKMKILFIVFHGFSSLNINFYKSEIFCYRELKNSKMNICNPLDVMQENTHLDI